MTKLSGVYIIQNKKNNKVYIGASTETYNRLCDHKWKLRSNLHHNIHLQSSFNFYGEENFSFDVLEYCDEDYIFSQENYWCNMLDAHNREYGYNIDPTSPYGKRRISEETRVRMCEKAEKRPVRCYTVYGDFCKDFPDLYKCGNYFNAPAPNIHRKMNVLFNKKNLIDSLISKHIVADLDISIEPVKEYWNNIFKQIKKCKGDRYKVYDCFGKFIGTADSPELSKILGVGISSISGSASRGTYLRTLKITK
jgi:group I intron endonuclease